MVPRRLSRSLFATVLIAMGLGVCCIAAGAQSQSAASKIQTPEKRPMSTAADAYGFTFEALEGGALPLAAWRGKPVLVVNTASFCGYTPQYTDLETLWQRYRDRGLIVLGVPSNDFGEQEPGSAAEIKKFCEGNYAVDFPLAAKAKTVGADAHPFFAWIAASLGASAAPRWNFHKYLVDPQGHLAGNWPSSVKPTDARITAEIERLLPRG